jgi:hypothetical protein
MDDEGDSDVSKKREEWWSFHELLPWPAAMAVYDNLDAKGIVALACSCRVAKERLRPAPLRHHLAQRILRNDQCRHQLVLDSHLNSECTRRGESAFSAVRNFPASVTLLNFPFSLPRTATLVAQQAQEGRKEGARPSLTCEPSAV